MRRILLATLVVLAFAFSRSVGPGAGRSFQILRHNINQVEMCVSNFGKFGQDETGNNPGCWWPKGSKHGYIFGAGTWFGTIDSATGDTLVTVGYNPHGGESEYTPGIKGISFSAPEAIIYMYPSPWPPPADKYSMAPQTSKSHQDSWCAYNDLDPTYHMPGDTRPIGLEVYQTVYAWNLSTTEDIIFIKFELKNVSGQRLTKCYFGVMADNDIGSESGTGNDICSGILNRTYVISGDTFVVDDVGYQWQTAQEPANPNQGVAAWWPGAMAFDYLQSPWDLQTGHDKDEDGIPDQYEMDSAYYDSIPGKWDVDGDGTPDWRDPSQIPQLGMTALKRVTLNLEPAQDYERYLLLAGYDFKTGVYAPYDTVPPQPDDQRILQCSGPFALDDGATATVLVGIVFANWKLGENQFIFNSPDSALAQIDATCQFIYDMNWLLPGPPPPPMLTTIPGDAKITLVWNNRPETTPDPYYAVVHPAGPLNDPFYRQYDFEGYGVWKSMTGNTGTWKVLSRYDLCNGITFDSPTQNDSVRLYADDTGIKHSYVDTDVRNGFTYYYAISSYDFNTVKGLFDSTWIDTFYVFIDSVVGNDTFWNPDTLWDYDTIQVYGAAPIKFESGTVGIPASARREPANYVAPGLPQFEMVHGNDSLLNLVGAEVVSPFALDANRPIYLSFANPETLTISTVINDTIWYLDQVKYTAYLKDVDGDTVGTMTSNSEIGKGLHLDQFQELDGIAASVYLGTDSFPSSILVFDSVTVGGSYPTSLIIPQLSPIPTKGNYCHGLWAYRGNDYQLTWKKTNQSGPVNTVVVIDVATGDTVDFKPFLNTTATRYLGEGWTFINNAGFSTAWSNPTDTIVGTGGTKTKAIYVNGGLVTFRAGNTPDTLRPGLNDVWVLHASQDYKPAPVYGEIKISATPGYFLTDTTFKFNVKVVPNPYIVYNEWQQNFNLRRLKFINLPNECTIRIFNLNGELVKILIHHATTTTGSSAGVTNNAGGDEWWDLLSEYRQLVVSGVYIFHIQSNVGEQVGKFVIIR